MNRRYSVAKDTQFEKKLSAALHKVLDEKAHLMMDQVRKNVFESLKQEGEIEK